MQSDLAGSPRLALIWEIIGSLSKDAIASIEYSTPQKDQHQARKIHFRVTLAPKAISNNLLIVSEKRLRRIIKALSIFLFGKSTLVYVLLFTILSYPWYIISLLSPTVSRHPSRENLTLPFCLFFHSAFLAQ